MLYGESIRFSLCVFPEMTWIGRPPANEDRLSLVPRVVFVSRFPYTYLYWMWGVLFSFQGNVHKTVAKGQGQGLRQQLWWMTSVKTVVSGSREARTVLPTTHTTSTTSSNIYPQILVSVYTSPFFLYHSYSFPFAHMYSSSFWHDSLKKCLYQTVITCEIAMPFNGYWHTTTANYLVHWG